MTDSQRKKKIIEYLSDTDCQTLKDIADKFTISMNTARKDIDELTEENLVKKFYGGVSLARRKNGTFQNRIASHIEEKQRTVRYAAALVDDNDLPYIDSGSTTPLLADYLHRDFHLTIVTNNICVITRVIEVVNWDLIVVGPKLKHFSCSLISVYDWGYPSSLNASKAFLTTTGLTIQGGVTSPDNVEIIVKISMMKRNQENFLLTDSSKLDRASLGTLASIEDFDEIIISGSVPKHFVEYCTAGNTQLIITQGGAPYEHRLLYCHKGYTPGKGARIRLC